jgi:hypothetical protein
MIVRAPIGYSENGYCCATMNNRMPAPVLKAGVIKKLVYRNIKATECRVESQRMFYQQNESSCKEDIGQ